MLATIALSAQAIEDLSQGPPSHQRKYHREFTELLMKHAVLIFGSEGEKRAFSRSIRAGDGIPTVSRQVWNAVIAEFATKSRLRVSDPPVASQLSSLTSLQDLYSEWKHKAKIVVVREELSPDMKLDEQESGVLEGTALEVATPITLSEGRIIRSLEDMERRGRHAYGAAREEFWSAVLAPLAGCTRNLVITDRYVFERMWDDADDNYRRDVPEQVCWLLERLDATLLPGASVKIIGQRRRPDNWGKKIRWSAEQTAEMIRDNWKRPDIKAIDKLEVVLAEPRGERPHDRHIRFGDIGVIDINAGIDMLSEPTVRKREGMKWSYGYMQGELKVYKEAATWLEAAPSCRSIVVP